MSSFLYDCVRPSFSVLTVSVCIFMGKMKLAESYSWNFSEVDSWWLFYKHFTSNFLRSFYVIILWYCNFFGKRKLVQQFGLPKMLVQLSTGWQFQQHFMSTFLNETYICSFLYTVYICIFWGKENGKKAAVEISTFIWESYVRNLV